MSDSYEVNTLDREVYETVRMVVEIRRRAKDGAIFTLHRPLTPGDQKRMNRWEGKGLPQVSRALLIEYLRREAQNMVPELPSGTSNKQVAEALEKRSRASIKSVIRGAVDSVLRVK